MNLPPGVSTIIVNARMWSHPKVIVLIVVLAFGAFMLTGSRRVLLKEFFSFCWQEKKWWLAPLLILLLVIGIFVIFASSTAIAPLIYSIF